MNSIDQVNRLDKVRIEESERKIVIKKDFVLYPKAKF